MPSRQPYTIWSLILLSVALSAIAQIVLKSAMSSKAVQVDMAANGLLRVAMNVLINPTVITGLILYGLGAVLWLAVLARLDVTQAYPFVGLGFIFTLILGYLFLNEPVGFQRLIGTLLITAGVVLVARS